MRVFSLLICLFVSFSASAAEWKSAGEVQGVQLYTRPGQGHNFNDYRGVVHINAPLKNVLAMVLVRESTPGWFHNMRQAVTLKDNNPESDLAYYWIKGVWPTADRDAVVRAKVEQDPSTLTVSVTITSVDPGLVPAKPDRVRMQNLNTLFTIKPIAPTETEVTLEGSGNPGGSVPAVIANQFVLDIPKYSLINLRKRAENLNKSDWDAFEANQFANLSMAKLKLPSP